MRRTGIWVLLAAWMMEAGSSAETMVLSDKSIKRELRVTRHYEIPVTAGQPAEAYLPVIMSFWGATQWQVVKADKLESNQPADTDVTALLPGSRDRRWRHLAWSAPKGTKIDIRETVELELTCFKALYTKARYPYPPEVLARFKSFLESDPEEGINLENPALDPICAGLKDKVEAEEIVEAACDWINENIQFAKGDRSSDEALAQRQGSCTPMSRLACAILRKIGIPAAVVTAKFIEGDGGHAFIEVYYPDAGWIFYDLSNRERGFKSPNCYMHGGSGFASGPAEAVTWSRSEDKVTDVRRYDDPLQKPGRVIRKAPRTGPCWSAEVHKGSSPDTLRARHLPLSEIYQCLSIPSGVREYCESATALPAGQLPAAGEVKAPPAAPAASPAVLSPAPLPAVASGGQGTRLWKSRAGTSVNARLVKRTNEAAVLEKADGSRITVKLADFDEADQVFLKTSPEQ